MKQYAVLLVFACFFMTFSGCGDKDDADALARPEALAERGPYTVGIRQTSVTYQPPGQENARNIPVVVWYPSHETRSKRHKLTLGGSIQLPTRAYEKVPIAEEGPFPVVVHSHGSGGEASLAYPAAEIFASRGWVVISISHTGNTTLDSLNDPLDVPMYIPLYRMLDVQRTLDAAADGFAWEEEFAEQTDVDNV